jgi:hypothetical protein
MDKDILNRFANKKLKYIMNLHSGFGIGKSWQDCFDTNSKKDVEKLLNDIGAEFYWKDDGGIRIEEIVDPILKHPITSETVFFSQADQWHPSSLDNKTYESMYAVVDEKDFYHNCYYGDNTPILLHELDFIRNLVKQESINFPWQNGDFLMLDNILTLHGRYAYSGARRILVAFSNFVLQI